MSLLLAIIADDLTGALDAAAAFSSVAGGVLVATSPGALNEALSQTPGVVAVSTRSRDLPANEAALQVSQVLALLPHNTRLFKKIDSRMKGNVESELEPFASCEFLCAPGLPEFGRYVKAGMMSGFGIDQAVDVASRLGKHAVRATICDTESEMDLDRAIAQADSASLLVGARSLAAALSRAMNLSSCRMDLPLETPACVAVGSTDPITCAQVTALRDNQLDAVYLCAPSGDCPLPNIAAFDIKALTILQATHGQNRPASEVAEVFAKSATPYLQAARTIVLSGGATAEATLDALKCSVLSLKGEALAGLPMCQSGPWNIVTKSGGFGAQDSLIRLFADSGSMTNTEQTGTLS